MPACSCSALVTDNVEEHDGCLLAIQKGFIQMCVYHSVSMLQPATHPAALWRLTANVGAVSSDWDDHASHKKN